LLQRISYSEDGCLNWRLQHLSQHLEAARLECLHFVPYVWRTPHRTFLGENGSTIEASFTDWSMLDSPSCFVQPPRCSMRQDPRMQLNFDDHILLRHQLDDWVNARANLVDPLVIPV
jgi:hypothetical protein